MVAYSCNISTLEAGRWLWIQGESGTQWGPGQPELETDCLKTIKLMSMLRVGSILRGTLENTICWWFLLKKNIVGLGTEAHAFNPSSRGRGRSISEFQSSLSYTKCYRTTRSICKTLLRRRALTYITLHVIAYWNLGEKMAQLAMCLLYNHKDCQHTQKAKHGSTCLYSWQAHLCELRPSWST